MPRCPIRPVPPREQSSPPDLTPVSGPIPLGGRGGIQRGRPSSPPETTSRRSPGRRYDSEKPAGAAAAAWSDNNQELRETRYAPLRVVEKEDHMGDEGTRAEGREEAWEDGSRSAGAGLQQDNWQSSTEDLQVCTPILQSVVFFKCRI